MPKENECKHEKASGRFCADCGEEVQSEGDRSRAELKGIFREVLEDAGLVKKQPKPAAPKKSVYDRALGR